RTRSTRTVECRRAAWAEWTCKNDCPGEIPDMRSGLPDDSRAPRKRYRFCNTISITFYSTVKGWRALPSERRPPKTRNKTPLFPRNLENPAKAGFFLAVLRVPPFSRRSFRRRRLRTNNRPGRGNVCVRGGTCQVRVSHRHARTLRCDDAARRCPLTVDYHLSLETDAFSGIPGPPCSQAQHTRASAAAAATSRITLSLDTSVTAGTVTVQVARHLRRPTRSTRSTATQASGRAPPWMRAHMTSTPARSPTQASP